MKSKQAKQEEEKENENQTSEEDKMEPSMNGTPKKDMVELDKEEEGTPRKRAKKGKVVL